MEEKRYPGSSRVPCLYTNQMDYAIHTPCDLKNGIFYTALSYGMLTDLFSKTKFSANAETIKQRPVPRLRVSLFKRGEIDWNELNYLNIELV